MGAWMMRIIVITTALAVVLLSARSISARRGDDQVNRSATSDGQAQNRQRLREGATIEAVGLFRKTGDRITFVPSDGTAPMQALENLTLERIARILADGTHLSSDGKPREWNMTATVTEFRGGNYLLVSRAVLKAKNSTTVPTR